MRYVNFVDLWIKSFYGTMAPRYLMFHVSLTVFLLFGTVKVLEAGSGSNVGFKLPSCGARHLPLSGRPDKNVWPHNLQQ